MSDDDRPWPPKLAPPNTLLGMLQRGTGAGFLRALSAPPERARAALMKCISVDPRIDHQVEARAEYYGELAIAIGLPPAAVDAWVRANDHQPDPKERTYLATATLGAMRQRGSGAARDILRGYLADGVRWRNALLFLVDDPPDDSAELEQILGRRFQNDDDLRTALVTTSWWGQEALATAPGRVGRLARELREGDEPTKAEVAPVGLADLPFAALMVSAVDHTSEVAVGKEIARRSLPIEALRPWLELPPVWSEATGLDGDRFSVIRPAGAALATMRALANRAEVEVFRIVLEIAVRPDGGQYGNAALRTSARRVLLTLPAKYLLQVARKWRTSPVRERRQVVELILEKHATEADIPRAQSILRAPLTARGVYRACHAVEILAHLARYGPFAEVQHAFDYFGYSYGRKRAARVLAASDPTFPGTRAFECLWDCETGTREIGCEHVDLGVPGAMERLRVLATDRVESELVRKAAAARLATRA